MYVHHVDDDDRRKWSKKRTNEHLKCFKYGRAVEWRMGWIDFIWLSMRFKGFYNFQNLWHSSEKFERSLDCSNGHGHCFSVIYAT